MSFPCELCTFISTDALGSINTTFTSWWWYVSICYEVFEPWLDFLFSKLVVLTVERNRGVYEHACMHAHMCMCVRAHVCAYAIAEWWVLSPRSYKTLGIQGRIRKEMAYSNESPLGRVSLQSEVLEDVGVGRKCPEEIPVGREGRADVSWKGRHMGKPFRVTFRAEVQVARHLAQGFSLSPVPFLSDHWFPTDRPRSEARVGRATSPLFWLLETKHDLVRRHLKGLWAFSLSVSSYCWQRPKNPQKMYFHF